MKDKRPQLIFQNYDVISKFLVSVLETDVDRVIVNSKNTYETVLEYLKKIGKENVEVVLNENEDLTQMHDIAGQIEEMKERKIWLKCGGFITIDKTEALTAIDINSGKFTGKKNSSKENTIYKVKTDEVSEEKQPEFEDISSVSSEDDKKEQTVTDKKAEEFEDVSSNSEVAPEVLPPVTSVEVFDDYSGADHKNVLTSNESSKDYGDFFEDEPPVKRTDNKADDTKKIQKN